MNRGISGLRLRGIPTARAVAALSEKAPVGFEFDGGPRFGGTGASDGILQSTAARRRAFFHEEAQRAALLGRQSAHSLDAATGGRVGLHPRTTRTANRHRMLGATRSTSRGHANLGIDGVEARVYSAGAPPHGRFLSAAAQEDRALKRAGARARGRAEERAERAWAVKRRAAAQDTYRGKRHQELLESYRSSRGKAGGRESAAMAPCRPGGGAPAADLPPVGLPLAGSTSARPQQATASKRATAANAKAEGVEPWMLDEVWMERPLTDGALRLAVQMRKNYGSSRQQSRQSSRSSRGTGQGDFRGVGRDIRENAFSFTPN